MSTQILAPVDSATYRAAVAHHAAGVAIVTSVADERPVGLTVSSFTSHSVDPPTVSCDLAVTTRTLPAIRSAGRFQVHLLSGDQEALATRFAMTDIDRFDDDAWSWWDGLPSLPGVMARFTCELAAEVTVGDHAVVFGTVTGVTLDAARSPLIHQARGFHVLD